MTDKIVVSITCGSAEEARRLARLLVEERLAACVQVLPSVRSVYRWRGAVEESEEWLLLIKTRRGLFEQLRRRIRAAHSYELPEILACPVVDGEPDYLAWIDAEVPEPGPLQDGAAV
ncbi:MAG: divalent-cation tolerance protein CutA [Bryobacteraceae bacterium]|jgi:periplasmic divalent cation tolerance protein